MAWLVLATNPATDKNVVQSRLVSSGANLKNVFMLNNAWKAGRLASSDDISGNNREEVLALARNRTTDKRAVQIRDYDTENLTDNIFP